jgi:hypothetical protein
MLAVLTAGLLACGDRENAQQGGSTTAQTAGRQQLPESVAHAVMIAKEIQANPDNAEAILKKHNMTREDFEQLLYDIAANADHSRLYADAMK